MLLEMHGHGDIGFFQDAASHLRLLNAVEGIIYTLAAIYAKKGQKPRLKPFEIEHTSPYIAEFLKALQEQHQKEQDASIEFPDRMMFNQWLEKKNS